MFDPTFVDHLNTFLDQYPGSVTRLCSTVAHNKAVGGAPNSGHLAPCVAADLVYDTAEQLQAAAKGAFQAGFMGIEVDLTNNHLHLDEKPRLWRVVHRGPGQDTPLDQWLTAEV